MFGLHLHCTRTRKWSGIYAWISVDALFIGVVILIVKVLPKIVTVHCVSLLSVRDMFIISDLHGRRGWCIFLRFVFIIWRFVAPSFRWRTGYLLLICLSRKRLWGPFLRWKFHRVEMLGRTIDCILCLWGRWCSRSKITWVQNSFLCARIRWL